MKKILLIALVALSSVTFAQDYLATSSSFYYRITEDDSLVHVETGCTITVTDEQTIKLFWESNEVDVLRSLGNMTADSMFQYLAQDNTIYDVRYRPDLNGWMLRKADRSYVIHILIDKEY